uniref:Uncharacterized protein n=1 Tax=Cacopsylla melanoneura TaxID=428564 RepID=A0A8D8XFS7_9HEMI
MYTYCTCTTYMYYCLLYLYSTYILCIMYYCYCIQHLYNLSVCIIVYSTYITYVLTYTCNYLAYKVILFFPSFKPRTLCRIGNTLRFIYHPSETMFFLCDLRKVLKSRK